MIFSVVMFLIGIFALIEGTTLAIFPDSTKRFGFKLLKTYKNTRKFGIIESIIGVMLILAASLF